MGRNHFSAGKGSPVESPAIHGGSCERNERAWRSFVASGTPGKREPKAQAGRVALPAGGGFDWVDGADAANAEHATAKRARCGSGAGRSDGCGGTGVHPEGFEWARARRTGLHGIVAELEI